MKEFSDNWIFHNLKVFCVIFKTDFLLYILPRMFGLEIEGFNALDDEDSEYESVEEDDN
jgi:hypothetical protein